MLSNTRMQRTTNLLRLALVCASLLVGNWATAWADIAPDPLSGGKNLTIKGRAKTNVVMADEVVKLKVSRDVCQTEVVFTMKNTGTKAESMQIGFPHYYPDELNDFKATVDEKPVKVTNATDKGTKGTLDSPGSPTVYWKIWETTFAPDHPVKVAVSYSIKLKERALLWLSDDSITHVLVSLLPKDDQPQLEKQLAARRVKYILVTGSHWSGPIGRCRIEVTLQGMTTENLAFESLSFEKDQAIITRDKIVWDLKDYEPKKDVEFAVTPNLTRAEMLKLLEKFRKQHPRDPSITKILSGFLIEAKRQPEADKIMLELLTHWRDKITIWGPERERDELLHEQSWEVFKMISTKINNDRPSTGFQNPSLFAPVIERIALRVQGQLKFIPPNLAGRAEYFADQIDKMLKWSKSHAMPE